MGDKKKIIVIIISIIIVILLGYISTVNKKELENNTKEDNWISKNITLVKDKSLGKNIYKVYKNSDISIFNLKYQEAVTKKIKDLSNKKKEDYLVIYNPYGTNLLSVNIFFKDATFTKLSYEVTSKGNTFSKDILLNDSNMYNLIGLSPGVNNEVKLTASRESKSITYQFNIDLSEIEINAQKALEVEKFDTDSSLVDGLFVMLGNESDYQNYIALYDNDGLIRGEIPIKDGICNDLVINNKNMYYNVSKTEIVRLNNLGEITNIYKLGKYRVVSNFQIIDNFLYLFVTDTSKETVKDTLIRINLDSNEVEEVLSVDKLFKDYIEMCKVEENKKLDYLDVNYFIIKDNDLFISSRETSSIIKISNFLEDGKIDYLIGSSLFFKDSPFKDLVFNQKGDFKIHASQGSISIVEDNNFYYLVLYDSNYGKSSSRDFNYNDIGIKNTDYKGDNSYYYVYKVNEEEKSFELVDSIELDYSMIGNTKKLDKGNILSNIGSKGIFLEYDKDHNLIRKYKAKVNKNYIYKIDKLSFNNFYFEEN